MNEQQTSAGDLARQMLRQQVADAKRRGTNVKPIRKPKRRRAQYGDGREPAPIERVLEQLADTYGWKRPSVAGRITLAWPRLMGEHAQRIGPDRYDADTRTLHLRPASPTVAAWARMQTTRILERLAAEFGPDAVTALRILPPGPIEAPDLELAPAPAPVPRPAVAVEPRPRAEQPAGFLEALAAVEGARAAAAAAGDERALRDRYFADIRGTLREPIEDDAVLEESAADPDTDHAEEIRQRAIQTARAQRTGRPIPGGRRLAEAS